MFAHCVLYSVPFAVAFGIDWRLYIIVVIHFIVDALKARYKRIGYVTDQMLHLATMFMYLLH